MQGDFEKRAELVIHEKCTPIGALPPERDRTCCLLGVCLCKGQGLTAARYHQNLIALLKKSFTPFRKRKDGLPLEAAKQAQQDVLKAHRALLDNGGVVLKLHVSSESETLPDSEGGEEVVGEWEDLLLADVGFTKEERNICFWFHVGYVNYSSWQLSLLRLQPAPHDRQLQSSYGFIRLELPEGDLLTDAIQLSQSHFMQLIDFDLEWLCTVHCVLENADSLLKVSCRFIE